MKKIRVFASFLILLLAFQIVVFGQSPTLLKALPEVTSPPHLVNDLGGMLTDEEELKLETKLIEYEKNTSNEIAIVTVDNIGEFEISEYANELGRKWNIGKSSKKNGVLILASKSDRKLNISPGYGLSGVLPDGVCGSIIRQQIVPNFKAGNFYLGFDEAIEKLKQHIANEFTADETTEDGLGFFVFLFIFLIFIAVIFFIFYVSRNRSTTYVSRRGWTTKNDDWNSNSGSGWLGGGFGGFGSGGSGSSDSGGGFGGFSGGGGGFDGGGASGSW
jgi:uncharacterized protein